MNSKPSIICVMLNIIHSGISMKISRNAEMSAISSMFSAASIFMEDPLKYENYFKRDENWAKKHRERYECVCYISYVLKRKPVIRNQMKRYDY